MWGRLATCGRLEIGLPLIVKILPGNCRLGTFHAPTRADRQSAAGFQPAPHLGCHRCNSRGSAIAVAAFPPSACRSVSNCPASINVLLKDPKPVLLLHRTPSRLS